MFYDKPSIEDIELGTRLSGQGVLIQIFPEVQVKHLKRWTLVNWLYTDIFRRGIPWVRLMRTTKNWSSQLNFSWSQRLASLSAIALVICIPFAAQPAFGVAGLLALAIFLIANFAFIDLVRKRLGLMASIAAIPLHIVYALVCVASVAAAFLYPPLKLPPTPRLRPLREQ